MSTGLGHLREKPFFSLEQCVEHTLGVEVAFPSQPAVQPRIQFSQEPDDLPMSGSGTRGSSREMSVSTSHNQ
jgi:hypothetical protein